MRQLARSWHAVPLLLRLRLRLRPDSRLNLFPRPPLLLRHPPQARHRATRLLESSLTSIVTSSPTRRRVHHREPASMRSPLPPLLPRRLPHHLPPGQDSRLSLLAPRPPPPPLLAPRPPPPPLPRRWSLPLHGRQLASVPRLLPRLSAGSRKMCVKCICQKSPFCTALVLAPTGCVATLINFATKPMEGGLACVRGRLGGW